MLTSKIMIYNSKLSQNLCSNVTQMQQILAELNCNMDTLQTSYPDSYVFLKYLEDRKAEMEAEE